MFFAVFFCVFCLVALAISCGVIWWVRDWPEYGWACAAIAWIVVFVLD